MLRKIKKRYFILSGKSLLGLEFNDLEIILWEEISRKLKISYYFNFKLLKLYFVIWFIL